MSAGEITVLASGALCILFSFFAWYGSGGFSINAWDDGLRPVALIPLIMGLFAAGHLALTKFAKVSLPQRVLGYTWEQLYLNAGFTATLYTTLLLLTDTFGGDKKFGFFISWLASIGLGVGAFLIQKDRMPKQ